MSRIETHRQQVPWSWVTWMTLPWLTLYYIDNVSHAGPLLFTLRKFVDAPALIAFLTSLNVAFNFVVGVFTSYMSDRVWTRWGRRRPFLIIGWIGVALTMAMVPLAPNLWTLILCIVVFQICADIAKPLEPLYNEVVPPDQRGRGATIRTIAQQLMGLVFFGLLLAQFDEQYDLSVWKVRLQFSGDAVLYWAGSLMVLGTVLFLCYGVRETPPPQQIHRERFRLVPFFKDLFCHRQWLLVYLLYAAPHVAAPGIDTFKRLVETEQLGFSKAQLGQSISIGLVAMIGAVMLAGHLADRVNRMRLFQVGLVGPAVVHFVFYLYIRYVADYSIPLFTLIAFGIVGGLFSACLIVVWGPLLFDYIPTDRFGTVSAGLAFVGGIAPFIFINFSGVWVTLWTDWFGSRAGTRYDYSGIFILQIVGAFAALAITCYVSREEKRGHLLPLGRMEKKAPPVPR